MIFIICKDCLEAGIVSYNSNFLGCNISHCHKRLQKSRQIGYNTPDRGRLAQLARALRLHRRVSNACGIVQGNLHQQAVLAWQKFRGRGT